MSSDSIPFRSIGSPQTAARTVDPESLRKRIPDTDGRMLTESEKRRLKEACQDFESIFLQMMMKSMRGSVEKAGLIDGGFGEEVFQDMLDEEITKSASKTQQLGIGKMLYDQLTRSVAQRP